MSSSTQDRLVIAIDYYDGEAEGFARCNDECSYFVRLKVGDDDVNEYASVAVDCALFGEIAAMAYAVCPPSGVFVYSGSNDALNQKLDECIPELRARLKQPSRRSQGRNYLDSIHCA